jgi:hypothetical protein
MNEQEYIELIDKEIAGTISPREKEALREYMRTTPGAERLYTEVLQTSDLLSRVGDVDPPDNLRKRIINSLDFSRYQVKRSRPVLRFLLKARQAGLKPRLAYAFALGAVVGLVVYSLFLTTPGGRYGSGVREMYGTIGINEESRFTPVETMPVDMPGAVGCVNLLRFEDLLRFEVSLSGAGEFDALIEYDPALAAFSGLRPAGEGEILLKAGAGRLRASGSGDVEFLLAFVKQTARAVPFDLKMVASGETILSHRFVIPEDGTVRGRQRPEEEGR